MEWKEKYTKKTKPPYNELLDFFEPDIRDLFIKFDYEMNKQFKVHNKYHRFLKTTGWAYGYGRNYSCELLLVIVQNNCFKVLDVSVSDEESMYNALDKVKKVYNDGFEERYASICTKKREDQIRRTKKRIEREKAEILKLMESVDPEKFNQFKWCKKVSRNNIFKLYQGEAKGIIDEVLLEDIGLSFYIRCKQAKETRAGMSNGQIICHNCGAILQAGKVSSTGAVLFKSLTDNSIINCECGYTYTYREYRRSYNTDNMPGNRATPIFDKYLEKWISCRDAKEKMIVIDWLIHEFHVTLMSNSKGKSVCENLIQGTRKQISELITKLAYE